MFPEEQNSNVFRQPLQGVASGSCLNEKARLQELFKKSGSGSLRETLNPNLVGWFAKSLVSRVDFPTPDGPDSTKGLRKSEATVVVDIVVR